jgi:surface protein
MIISLIKKLLFIGLVISWITFIAYIQGGATDNTLASRVVELLKNDSFNNNEPFVTTWKTDMPDQEWKILYPKNIAFFLPKSFEYDFLIDWGDGNKERIKRGRLQEEWNISHEYSSPGVYTVTISGKFPTFRTAGGTYKPNSPDNLTAHKLLTVEKWWTNQWEMLNATFLSANNMKIMATDIPNLSQVKNMSWMFSLASSFNQPLGDWDVSNVTDMAAMFSWASSFNQPLQNWDVSNVTNMKMMFWANKSFNQPIWNWDVSNVKNMAGMLYGTDAFNQDIWNWNLTKIQQNSLFLHM